MTLENPACFVQPQPPSDPIEQRNAKNILEFLQAARHSGLRHA